MKNYQSILLLMLIFTAGCSSRTAGEIINHKDALEYLIKNQCEVIPEKYNNALTGYKIYRYKTANDFLAIDTYIYDDIVYYQKVLWLNEQLMSISTDEVIQYSDREVLQLSVSGPFTLIKPDSADNIMTSIIQPRGARLPYFTIRQGDWDQHFVAQLRPTKFGIYCIFDDIAD